ncbi:glycosyltransferase family 41 protein [Polynucleobacter sp. KF022]|uniref:tetratricopeptide repeat protein n=1 Tax=Polynucleobacter sp. KF022 TaxID=2982615 RepID=UPI00249173F8|nr:glycosyltransferase family 41 protein [Polynucleobacter sp. KF022]
MNPQIGLLLNQSLESLRSSNFESAEIYLKQVIKLEPSNPHALRLLGVLSAQNKQYSDAIRYLNDALIAMPNNALALSNLGNIYLELKQPTKALDVYQKSITIDPHYAEVWSNKGNALFALNRYEEALEHHHQALSLNPNYAEAYSNAGNTLNHLKRYEEAIAYYQQAILLNPNYPEAYFNMGNALTELKNFEQAISCYRSALDLNPTSLETRCNIGVVFNQMGRPEEALVEFEEIILRNPNYAEAYLNKGGTLVELKKFEEAITSFERAISLKSDIDWALGDLLFTKMKISRWEEMSESIKVMENALLEKKRVIQPFALLAISDNPRLHSAASEIYAAEKYPAISNLGNFPKYLKKEKIRIGYFSPDFRTHPVSFLTAELFQKHDRSRFEIIGFSMLQAPQGDKMRARLKDSFDIFIDAENMSDAQIANLAREMEIDVAVDLSGPTQHSRVGVMAHRAAPIQVNWLGYPGTYGASFVDYIIADEVILPEENKQFFVEKVAYLPKTYMVDDSRRLPSGRVFTKVECGLPEDGFIFCCFNNDYKFNKEVLDCWASILLRVPGSVLWISENNPAFRENILAEFELRAVGASRIIFAKRMDLMSDHLARYALADLFLDTFPYNAHSTAVDSLKTGVPIVTLLGKSFAGRVAASLLTAAGLVGLIATTKDQYEDIVCDLATNPQKLLQYRKILVNSRLNGVLFNSSQFARNIEASYSMMYERHHQGLQPDHLKVN